MDNELTESNAGLLKGNKSILKVILKILYQIGGLVITHYKESIWNYSNMTGKLHRTPTLCRHLKCYVDLCGNSNGSYICHWTMLLKSKSRQWNLVLYPPCFLSWCQIYYLQQRKKMKAESHFSKEELYMFLWHGWRWLFRMSKEFTGEVSVFHS